MLADIGFSLLIVGGDDFAGESQLMDHREGFGLGREKAVGTAFDDAVFDALRLDDAAGLWARVKDYGGASLTGEVVGGGEAGDSGPDDDGGFQILAARRRILPLLLALAQLAEIFRNGVAVALRCGFAAGTADAAIAAGLFHFAAQFHFHLLDIAERGLNALA